MSIEKIQHFVQTYEKPLKILEITIQIVILIAIAYLLSEKYFLHYKVVLVEQDASGEYNVVKEIIQNGKITDPIYMIDVTKPEHNGEKLILNTTHVGNRKLNDFNNSFIIS